MYVENKKYLHFFEKKDSVLYLDTIKGKYICTYDIPYKLFDEYSGMGYYLDRIKFKTLEQVHEYAIPCNYILFDYLLRVEEIIEDMDFDDYLYDNMDNKLVTIYEKEIKNDNKKERLVLILKKNN